MNRREFVKMLALLAAGAAARPEQIAAFTRYYDANTPMFGGPFIAVDEISLSGLSCIATVIRVNFYNEDEVHLPAGFNGFGGVYFWRAGPDGKLVLEPKSFRWVTEHFYSPNTLGPSCPNSYEGAAPAWVPRDDAWVAHNITGHIKYIDQDAVRHTKIFETAVGRLA